MAPASAATRATTETNAISRPLPCVSPQVYRFQHGAGWFCVHRGAKAGPLSSFSIRTATRVAPTTARTPSRRGGRSSRRGPPGGRRDVLRDRLQDPGVVGDPELV